MTIDEAIKFKRKYQYILQDASLPELIEADNLSIEALMKVRDQRACDGWIGSLYLPGESKD